MVFRMLFPNPINNNTNSGAAWHLPLLILLVALTGCSSVPSRQGYSVSPTTGYDDNIELLDDLLAAEEQADDTGRRILATGRNMTLVKQEIVRGSCWDYTNAVYDRSGYPNDHTSRKTVFKGSKDKGPYADAELIQPGDWLYYINHSYNDSDHSAIFIKWLERDKHIALMLSYGGEKRREPARYLPYDLSHVYRIMRPAKSAEDNIVSVN